MCLEDAHPMLRTIALTLLFLLISLGGGISSVWYTLNANVGFGAIRIGVWTAFPQEGSDDADPYSVARRARDAKLPLGRAVGLSFFANTDSDGQTLSGQCNYQLVGNVPQARFWTIYPASPSLEPLETSAYRNAVLHSRQLLRRQDSSFVISIGPDPAAGNWISVTRPNQMVFVLTLYDTQIASTVASAEREFPSIINVGCRDE